MATEVLVGAERRVLISGYGALPAPPPPDSLLGRLDQIDLRVRMIVVYTIVTRVHCCRVMPDRS
jgi:hypothetical protein